VISKLNALCQVAIIWYRSSDLLHGHSPIPHTSFFRILESIHTGFLVSFNNTCFINGFGDLVVLRRIPWCVYLILLIHQFSVQRPGIFWCVPLSRPSGHRKIRLTTIQVSFEISVSLNNLDLAQYPTSLGLQFLITLIVNLYGHIDSSVAWTYRHSSPF